MLFFLVLLPDAIVKPEFLVFHSQKNKKNFLPIAEIQLHKKLFNSFRFDSILCAMSLDFCFAIHRCAIGIND